MIARQSGMDYSPGIHLQTSLINMELAKELTMRNQLENSLLEEIVQLIVILFAAESVVCFIVCISFL